MGTCCRNRATCALAALVIALAYSPLASAQDAGSNHLTDSVASSARNDIDPAPSEEPDLSIISHDVVGEFGTAVPLDIKLVLTRTVVVEGIRLLGLPLGATISDATNTFSPSEDKDDADIRTWDISKLQITYKDRRNQNVPLTVAAIWKFGTGGHLEVTTSRFNVSFVQGNRDRMTVNGGELSSSKRPTVQIHETTPSTQRLVATVSRDASISGVLAADGRAGPLEGSETGKRPAVPAAVEGKPGADVKAVVLPRPPASPQRTSRVDPLVERAKGLIRLGDISGARLLLERARTRNAPNATFLLAQTWDPAMLRSWKVRGLQPDPALARSLYAMATAEEGPEERILAATSR
ncbi:hypothetical protein SAMN02799622_04097 [Methylobacterium sp. UNC378MF]|nr:hypothetical protein SAMN02799622_04097 [Methylobacterium sp. UNC378MF]